jgi:hypothetical protein
MNLYSIFGILIAIVLVNKVVLTVMDFLGVPLDIYNGYLLWFIALILFYGLLPQSTDYFSNSH